jgi:hypothetical protein
MAEYLAVVITTLALTGLFTYMLVRTDIDSIKGDWVNRRCELPVMVMAGLCKPDDNPKSRMAFAQENFTFCVKKNIDTVLKTALAPFYSIAGQHVNSLGTMNGPLNSIRSMISNAVESFKKLMDRQYRQFTAINAKLVQTWQHLLFSVGRIQAIFYSVVYAGLSIQTLIQNTLGFTLRAIMIFIGIMVSIIILLFFVLFPVIPVILTMITILAAAASVAFIGVSELGGAGGMAGAFCIDPTARVAMKDGTCKELRNIKLGDVLMSSKTTTNEVIGILEADARNVNLVEIGGILMSEDHRVKHNGLWILAKQHPNAVASTKKLDRVICLNTTTHEVSLVSNDVLLSVGDWEEVSSEEGQKLWIDMVNTILNGQESKIKEYPNAVPLVSLKCKVNKKGFGLVPISSIKIGDFIESCNNTFTKVVGTYNGKLKIKKIPESEEWTSDGVWIKTEKEWSTATGIPHVSDGSDLEGMFLITENEQFNLYSNDTCMLVRDFTEVGASRINETYDILDWVINKK